MFLRGIGLEVSDGSFPLAGRLALKLLSSVPSAWRERLIFGGLLRQKALQRLLGGPQPLLVRYTRGPLAGLTFRCESAEKYFLIGADYERVLLPAIRGTLTPASVVYDVGANAGYWSLAFARLCPAGIIYAFEPSPINHARLALNIATLSNIHPVCAAVSDRNGSVRFSERGSTSRISSDGEAEVPTIRLDDFNLSTPGFLKIDVEGRAGAALAGAYDLLRKVRPAVMCEVHDSSEEQAVGRILGDLGYGLTVIERLRAFPFHIVAK